MEIPTENGQAVGDEVCGMFHKGLCRVYLGIVGRGGGGILTCILKSALCSCVFA